VGPGVGAGVGTAVGTKVGVGVGASVHCSAIHSLQKSGRVAKKALQQASQVQPFAS
jgi:hypothetical protein